MICYKRQPQPTTISAIDKIYENPDFKDPTKYQNTLPKRYRRFMTFLEPPQPDGMGNCYGYAFGNKRAGKSTVLRTIEDIALVKKLRVNEKRIPGDIVLYYLSGDLKHAGKIVGKNTVVSQWDNRKPVLKHGLLMVPSSYGYCVEFIRVKKKNCLNEFFNNAS